MLILTEFLDLPERITNIRAFPPMKTSKLLIAIGALALAAAKLNAQTITATLATVDPGVGVTGTMDFGVDPVNVEMAYPSGVLDFTTFKAFCVEPLQGISYGQTLIYQVQDSSLLTNSGAISRLIGGYLASTKTDQQAAAVQWAIWELTNETTKAPSLTDGNVRITGGVADQSIATLANQYLASINTYTPASITFLTNDTYQNVVTWNAVPEPASVGLVGLSGLLVLGRRRRR